MKKIGQSIFILFVSLIVFLTGAGVTVVNLCCMSCGGQTLFVVEQLGCCATQMENANTGDNKCCLPEAHQDELDKHCSTTRLSIDTDSFSFRPQLSSPYIWISEMPDIMFSFLFPHNKENARDRYASFSPPTDSPRRYLSMISVLII